MKFSTWTIAAFGSTIRKYATAFTRTGTLSFVITSCGGMLSVIVRRSTFTIRSTIGIRMKSPGPFGAGSRRPRRKTMPRSYSRATLIAENRKRTIRNRRIAMMTRAALTDRSYSLRAAHRPHREDEAVERLDADTLARPQLLAAGSSRLPELAVDEHEAAAPDL